MIRAGSVFIALAMAMILVGQTMAAPISTFDAVGSVRQVSSYEQQFNPFGDPWAGKMGPNVSIPVGLTPACHRRGLKADNETPNAAEVTFVARSGNPIVWEECGDPMEPPPPGSPPALQRQGDPVLKNFVAAVKQQNPSIKYVGYIKLPVHSTQSLGAPVTPAGLLDFESREDFFIHIDGLPATKANRVKYVDRVSDIYDVTNPAWRAAMAAKLKASLDYHQMDGLTIDACFDLPEVSGRGPSATVLANWEQGCIDSLAALKQGMPEKLVFPMGYNSIKFPNSDAASFSFFARRVDVSDGFYWEQALASLVNRNGPPIFYNGTVSRYRQVQDYVVQRGKYLGNLVNTTDQNQPSFAGATRQQQLLLARFYLAGHLTQFVDAKTLMHLWTPTSVGEAFVSDAFFKDWDFNIGTPTGESTRPAGPDVAVWQREFQRARVVLNASDRPFTVNLTDGTYKTLDGISVASFEMPPATGMVFLLPGSDPLPVTAPTPDPTPDPGACTPRPRVQTAVTKLGDGRLRVTLTAGAGAGNIRTVRLLSTQNAIVDFDSRQNVTGAFTHTLSTPATSLTFTIRRPGTGTATTVPMIVTDGCGDWRTLAGTGPGN